MKSSEGVSNTRIINYEAIHIRTADKKTFTADESECPFCKAAFLFGCTEEAGDFIFIMINSDDIKDPDKNHVHQVTYHGMTIGIKLVTLEAFEQPLYSCEHTTLEEALNSIRRKKLDICRDVN